MQRRRVSRRCRPTDPRCRDGGREVDSELGGCTVARHRGLLALRGGGGLLSCPATLLRGSELEVGSPSPRITSGYASPHREARGGESLRRSLAEQIVPGAFARRRARVARLVLAGRAHARRGRGVRGPLPSRPRTRRPAVARRRGGPKPAAASTQVLGDDDEAVRDLQAAESRRRELPGARRRKGQGGRNAKLVVGGDDLDQTAPVAIVEGVRAFAVARGPRTTAPSSAGRRRGTSVPKREALSRPGRRSAAAVARGLRTRARGDDASPVGRTRRVVDGRTALA